MEIDTVTKKILEKSGIFFLKNETVENENAENENVEPEILILIERDSLLNNNIYNELKNEIMELKKIFSSSALTSLQKEADKKQKWPLLNLVRQVLQVYGYKMTPIRKCDGYTEDGIKRFKRYFSITKMQKNPKV
jgi:hypothetical protein